MIQIGFTYRVGDLVLECDTRVASLLSGRSLEDGCPATRSQTLLYIENLVLSLFISIVIWMFLFMDFPELSRVFSSSFYSIKCLQTVTLQ